MIYRFERRGRSVKAALTVGVVWGAALALWLGLDASIWIALTLVLFTLPALWDIAMDTTSMVEVWPNRISWASRLGEGDRADIDHVRLNRRFDGTMKVTLVHLGGATTRLPADIAPPVAALEAALEMAGIAHERHPFSPI